MPRKGALLTGHTAGALSAADEVPPLASPAQAVTPRALAGSGACKHWSSLVWAGAGHALVIPEGAPRSWWRRFTALRPARSASADPTSAPDAAVLCASGSPRSLNARCTFAVDFSCLCRIPLWGVCFGLVLHDLAAAEPVASSSPPTLWNFLLHCTRLSGCLHSSRTCTGSSCDR